MSRYLLLLKDLILCILLAGELQENLCLDLSLLSRCLLNCCCLLSCGFLCRCCLLCRRLLRGCLLCSCLLCCLFCRVSTKTAAFVSSFFVVSFFVSIAFAGSAFSALTAVFAGSAFTAFSAVFAGSALTSAVFLAAVFAVEVAFFNAILVPPKIIQPSISGIGICVDVSALRYSTQSSKFHRGLYLILTKRSNFFVSHGKIFIRSVNFVFCPYIL